MPIQMPSKKPVLVAMASAALLLFAACSTKSTSLPAKATVSNGLYPYVTPLCTPHSSFGAASAGVTTEYSLHGYKGSRYYLSGSGRAYSISAYFEYPYSAYWLGLEVARVALYRDFGGHPSTLLSLSGKARLAAGWIELDITDVDVTPGWYWIMFVGYNSAYLAFNTGAANSSYDCYSYQSTYEYPSTFDLPMDASYFSNRLYSMKVNYCP
jgi:hypothetical protein